MGAGNTRDLVRRARQLGAQILEKGSDYKLRHPAYPRIVTVTKTRKDAARVLKVFVKRLEKAAP